MISLIDWSLDCYNYSKVTSTFMKFLSFIFRAVLDPNHVTGTPGVRWGHTLNGTSVYSMVAYATFIKHVFVAFLSVGFWVHIRQQVVRLSFFFLLLHSSSVSNI